MNNFQITGFVDGDSYVIVTKGLDNPFVEILKAGINALGGTEAPASAAQPTNTVISPCAVGFEDDNIFKDGPYKGLAPIKLVDADDPEEAMVGFNYLSEVIRSQNGSFSLLKSAKSAQQFYAYARFLETDPYEYAARLSEKQCRLFIKTFDTVIEEKVKNAITDQSGSKDWESFIAESGVDILQSAVGAVIEGIKTMKIS